MTASAGIWMLAGAGALLIATGLPAWVVLISIALAFAVGGIVLGTLCSRSSPRFPYGSSGCWRTTFAGAALYVLMGALLNHLPLAEIIPRAGNRALARTGAEAPAALGLGVLFAP